MSSSLPSALPSVSIYPDPACSSALPKTKIVAALSNLNDLIKEKVSHEIFKGLQTTLIKSLDRYLVRIDYRGYYIQKIDTLQIKFKTLLETNGIVGKREMDYLDQINIFVKEHFILINLEEMDYVEQINNFVHEHFALINLEESYESDESDGGDEVADHDEGIRFLTQVLPTSGMDLKQIILEWADWIENSNFKDGESNLWRQISWNTYKQQCISQGSDPIEGMVRGVELQIASTTIPTDCSSPPNSKRLRLD